MKFFRVKNWEKYQHYKDRKPIWIKLHTSLLSDYGFSAITDEKKYHLIAIWLLAASLDNKIPYDGAWVSKHIQASSPVDLSFFESIGFITAYDDASNALASCYGIASLDKEKEKEEEKENPPTPLEGGGGGFFKNGEQIKSRAKTQHAGEQRFFRATTHFEKFWKAYPKRVSKGQAERAWRKLSPDEQLIAIILQAIERAKTSEKWLKNGGQYIPYPATWLNAKGWLDEIESSRADPPKFAGVWLKDKHGRGADCTPPR